MGPEVLIYTSGHEHSRTDIPMIKQGSFEEKRAVSYTHLKTFARKVMKHGLLDFVGSDGHRKTERIPEIGKCVAKMEKTMGSEYVKKIFIKNPRKITG